MIDSKNQYHQHGHDKYRTRNATIVRPFLEFTILVLITALFFQRIRTKSGGTSIIEKLSFTASVESKIVGEGERDPEAETCGISTNDEKLMMRLDPARGRYNDVRCWTSVGRIIIAERVYPVELVFLGLDRFYPTPRSPTSTQEDEFCKKLRMVGGKWWTNYLEFEWATKYKMRQLWPDEIEVLYLGWPEDKPGVWLLRFGNRRAVRGDIGTIYNALMMDECCSAIKLSGGTFFQRPEDSDYIAPLVQGLGNRKQRKDPDLTEDGESWDY